MARPIATAGAPYAAPLVAALLLAVLWAPPLAASTAEAAGPAWAARLERRLAELPQAGGGRLAVYVRDLQSGEAFSLRGEETSYLASGVKVPVAVELLRQVQQGTLSLDATIRLEALDLIDGSPCLSLLEPGSLVSLRELLEQMLIHSDNTATDLLIRQVGLENVNAGLMRLVPEGFRDITTLADVRRRAYSGIFPEAARLTNDEILRLGAARGDRETVRTLARLLHTSPEAARTRDLSAAFAAYYASGLNSATPAAYAELLAGIAGGRALGPEATALLLDLMSRVETGKQRIRAGLPPAIVWAHKTGTQRARVADFGVAWPAETPEHRVVVAAVASEFASQQQAERALRLVGAALQESGIFSRREEPKGWPASLEARLQALDRGSPGELGVWVKRLATDEEMGYQATRPWYLSSTIKVPVAIALLRKVEAGELSLDRELTLQASDFVDGAGEVQGMKPGTKVSVAYLLEKMLVQSDSTAADMLIRQVGLPELNALLKREGFGPATTLLQVRLDVYGELHPDASRLSNVDYIEIRRAESWEARRRLFAKKIGVSPDELEAPSLEAAFERYYERGLNSASLVAFGKLLEKLAEGRLLSPEHTALVLRHMQAMTTGEDRLKAGLPQGVRFAQKTGTQVRRICNMGVVDPGSKNAVVVTACVEKFPDQTAAEALLMRVGQAVAESGALQ